MQRCLLINPPTGRYIRDDRCQGPVDTAAVEPARAPIDLAYMAAVLREAGLLCRIRDFPAEEGGWADLQTELERFEPDALVIATTAPTLLSDLRAAHLAKQALPQIRTVVKGPHLAVVPKEDPAWDAVDAAIYLEPEFTVRPVLTGERPLPEIPGVVWPRPEGGGWVVNPRPQRLQDLEQLPLPARDLLSPDLYRTPDTGRRLTVVWASVGCPHKCTFCLAPFISGPQLRFRRPESVVEELEHCVSRYQTRDFFLRADTFTIDRRWVLQLCRLIRERKLRIRWGANSRVDTVDPELLREMAAAGCWILGFGVESADQETLDRSRKRARVEQASQAVRWCREAGIRSHCMYIIGFPWEGRAEIERTSGMALQIDSDFADFNIAFPMPGTELYQYALDRGLIEPGQVFGHDYTEPIHLSEHLTPTELSELRSLAISRFYLRPRYMWRTLRRIRSPMELGRYAAYALRLAGHPLRAARPLLGRLLSAPATGGSK